MPNRYQLRREARRRWSLNAVRKRGRNRIQRASATDIENEIRIFKPRRTRPDLKINLERKDGGRMQFSLHYFQGKMIGGGFQMSPKQLGRKMGEIFNLWMMP